MDERQIEDLLTRVAGNDRLARAELKRILVKNPGLSGSSTLSAAMPARSRRAGAWVPDTDASVTYGVIPPEVQGATISNVHLLADNVASCAGTLNEMLMATRNIRDPINNLNTAWEKLARVSEVQSNAWIILGEKLQKINENNRKKSGYTQDAPVRFPPHHLRTSPVMKAPVSAPTDTRAGTGENAGLQ